MKPLAYISVLTLVDPEKGSPYSGDFDCRWLHFSKWGVSILHSMTRREAA